MDATVRKVQELREAATHARTLMRAFNDYADDIVHVLPTKGNVADIAADRLAVLARAEGERCRTAAIEKMAAANKLEAELS